MSRHTKRRHHSYKRRHTKRRHHSHKRNHHSHKQNHHSKKRHMYRKRREFVIVPGSKSVPIFTEPQKKNANKIVINNDHNQIGNIVPGLRNFIKNM
jgi:hypothetical protein